MKARRIILSVATLTAAILIGTTLGFSSSHPTPALPAVAIQGPTQELGLEGAETGSNNRPIAKLEARVRRVPRDYVALATLGLAYVQQAGATADSQLYPEAELALNRSLALNPDENFLAYAGLAALANARHDFASARTFANQGLKINPASAVLLGALGDAETQLGEYQAASDTVQRMVDRSPDAASLARASYVWELRGDVDQARALMTRALHDAPDAAARSFALVHLGEIALDNGDANTALAQYLGALQEVPQNPAALAGKARAEVALGQKQTAIDDYTVLITRVPDPVYVVELGELLQSMGRNQEANVQFELVAVTERLRRANGVTPDAASVLFLADHGHAAEALTSAEQVVASRPFIAIQDAHAWALHRNGRDQEALAASDRSLATGFRSAEFRFHRAMIELALGDTAAARADLGAALAINPTFSVLRAPIAAQTLQQLRVA
jgi:tetratricopeptide (TPR) repeat protein